MISECFVFGIPYCLIAALGYTMCVPSVIYGYFKMYKTTEAPFGIGIVAISFAVAGFVMTVFGVAPYLPCVSVVMFP